MSEYGEFHEPDYAELIAKNLAIQKEVDDAETIVDIHTYAAIIYPKFCKEMLKEFFHYKIHIVKSMDVVQKL